MLNRASSRGFTLLEVLVASAIVVSTIGIIIQLFGASMNQMDRVEFNAKLIVVQREVGHRLRYVNPLTESSGRGVASGWPYEWQASQTRELRPVSTDLGEPVFDRSVALFRIDIEVTPEDRAPVSWSIDRLGWTE